MTVSTIPLGPAVAVVFQKPVGNGTKEVSVPVAVPLPMSSRLETAIWLSTELPVVAWVVDTTDAS